MAAASAIVVEGAGRLAAVSVPVTVYTGVHRCHRSTWAVEAGRFALEWQQRFARGQVAGKYKMS